MLSALKRLFAFRRHVAEVEKTAPSRPLRFMDPAVVQESWRFGRAMGDADRSSGHASLGQAISAFARGYESAFDETEPPAVP